MSPLSRVLAWDSRIATGSLRFAGGFNSARPARGKSVRRRLPAASRSSMEGRGAVNWSASFLPVVSRGDDVFVDLGIGGSSMEELFVRWFFERALDAGQAIAVRVREFFSDRTCEETKCFP